MTYTLDPPLPTSATPKDYTRFHFDTSQVPAKRIVGLLACQRDPLLRSLRTTVHSAREATIAAPPIPKGKVGSKKKSATSTSTTTSGNATPVTNGGGDKTKEGKLWEVELNDTVIFPEGGGQPFDTGLIHLLDPNGDKRTSTFVVEGCLRKKLDSVHLVRVPNDVQVDWEGREVEVEVDWERRMDQMSIHTSQHLLSAVLDAPPYVLPTLSWSMHAFPSLEPPYVELSRSLTQDEAEAVERRCTELIGLSKKVWVDVSVQGGEVGHSGEEDERNARGLPKDYSGGVIRHINIQDTDRNACCGTQSPSLSLLSLIHVIPPTTSSTSATKLYFTAGPRAIRYLQATSRTLTAAAQVVGCGRGDLVEKLERLEVQRKEAVDAGKSLKAEMAKYVAEQAVKEGHDDKAKGIVWIKREEKSTHDFEFLGSISSTYLQSFVSSDKPLIITTSSPVGITPTLLMIQSTDQDLAKDVNERLKKVLEGRVKGGGAKGRYMCKVDGKWGKVENGLVDEVVKELREKVGA
ncbi:hypothetical protein CI109_107234 [Kwoniella shandongensis]|uniref:Uncharacterized protein n=1 Tax=Kwoniella shandongensis TaxID=1734106 RepID=A0A5M6C228_9TREE|nr:uncharacterized protein CI109_002517 [Kwoniella shandongensis]KAA5529176.1 hypothetical protein CI109_002517 [Kwoniella shandongensis]